MPLGVVHARKNLATYVASAAGPELTIGANQFTAGHRYLILCNVGGVSGGTPSAGQIQYRVGGAAFIDGIVARNGSQSGNATFQWSVMDLQTLDGSTDTVDIATFVAQNNPSYADFRILCLDLDSGLVENSDWFYTVNGVIVAGVGIQAWGTGGQGAQVNFTPDGTSDYLVVGFFHFNGLDSLQDLAFRVRDTTNSVTYGQHGVGGHNAVTERNCLTTMKVMSAPAATPVTLETQFQSGSPGTVDKWRMSVFVLRLGAFQETAVFSSDLASTPGDTNFNQFASLPYTPDSSGNMVVLADMKSETDGLNGGTTRGLEGQIEYPAANNIFDVPGTAAFYHSAHQCFPGFDTARVGPACFEYLTGQSPGDLVGLSQAQSATADNELRDHTLLAFGTEFATIPMTTDPVSPTVLPARGGTLVTITGVADAFNLENTYRVHLGVNGDATDPAGYAGATRGTAIKPTSDTVLEFYSPPLTDGFIINLFIEEIETAVTSLCPNIITVVAAGLTTSEFSFKRLFAPNRLVGPRNLTVFPAPNMLKNYITESRDLTSPAWTPRETTVTDTEEDPFGGTSGFILVESNATDEQFAVDQPRGLPTPVLVAGDRYTLSVYAKAVNRDWLVIGVDDGTNQIINTTDVSTGTAGAFVSGTGEVAVWPVPLVVDWYQVALTFIAPASASFTVIFGSAEADGSIDFDGGNWDALRLAFPSLDPYPIPRGYLETGETPSL